MQMERWLRERKDLDPSGKTTTRNWPLKINFLNAETKRREQLWIQNLLLGEGGLLLGCCETPRQLQHGHCCHSHPWAPQGLL